MPKRGDFCKERNLYFWRISRGIECWITAEVLQKKRNLEALRLQRFHEKNPEYIAFSHTKEQQHIRGKKYRSENKEKRSLSFSNWSKRNKDRLREYARNRYHTNNSRRSIVLANSALRRNQMRNIGKNQRFEIEFLYAFSKSLSAGGIKHVVDHVYPIKPTSRLYCGITSISNLQIIPQIMNARKKNKCPIEQQAQNAQIGKIGTAPASVGGMNTQNV